MTLLRIEVHAAEGRADDAERVLLDARHVINVSRHRGALVSPPGDVLACDVPREAAHELIEHLHDVGLCGDDAGVTVDSGLVHVATRADRAERAAGGSASDALVWRLLRDTLDEEIELSFAFVLFMVLATMLGAIGVVTNSAILVVGAMVIGPEFGPLASGCLAVLDRDWRSGGRAVVALVVGFAIAIAVTAAFAVAMDATGVFPSEVPLTGLVKEVASPGWLSLVIALIAGSAGTLALTSARNGSLIGVLISVTTIPAAADASVLLADGHERAALDSLTTLAVNLVGMAVAGTLTLAAHRGILRRVQPVTRLDAA